MQASGSISPISVSISDSPDPIAPGGRLAYSVFVENDGAVARNLVVSVAYPANTTYAASDRTPEEISARLVELATTSDDDVTALVARYHVPA